MFEELLENWKGNRFSEFAARYARDKRFLVIEKMRERETLFFQYKKKIENSKKEDEKAKKEQIKENFMTLLAEKEVQQYLTWKKYKFKYSVLPISSYFLIEMFQMNLVTGCV